MVRELAKVKSLENGNTYYVDLVLHQLRNVDNPHDYEQFSNSVDMSDYITELMFSDKLEVV